MVRAFFAAVFVMSSFFAGLRCETAGAMKLGPFVHTHELLGIPLKLSTQVDINQITVDDVANVKFKSVTDLSSIKAKISKIINKIADENSRKFDNHGLSFEIYISNIQVRTVEGKASVQAVGSLIDTRWEGIPVPLVGYLSNPSPTATVKLPPAVADRAITAAFVITVPLDFRMRDEGAVDFVVERPSVVLNDRIKRLVDFYNSASGNDLAKTIEDKAAEKIAMVKTFENSILKTYKVSVVDKRVYSANGKLYLELKMSAVAGGDGINPYITAFLSKPVDTKPDTGQTASVPSPGRPLVRVELNSNGR